MIYRKNDLIKTTAPIGRGTITLVKEDRWPFPPVLPEGALGQVISDINGEVTAYLEDAKTKALHTVRIPLSSKGKLAQRIGGKMWA
jgi:hypothetical protein